MRFPVRLLRDRWPRPVQERLARFTWPDPRVIMDADVASDDFRVAMNAFEVGGTIKVTEANRHPEADALLLDNVDTSHATIVDIGASDGSTSLDLIGRLPQFTAYVIADLFLELHVITDRGRSYFYDPFGTCVLICGRRVLAWPTRSALVRRLWSPLVRRAQQRNPNRRPVSMLNPRTRALLAADDRVTSVVHDVFDPWPAPAPDVIKVANLLGHYFSDEDISRALLAVLSGLDDGGHLLLVDNGKPSGGEPRAALYRRTADRFERVAQARLLPQIDPLALGVRAGAGTSA